MEESLDLKSLPIIVSEWVAISSHFLPLSRLWSTSSKRQNYWCCWLGCSSSLHQLLFVSFMTIEEDRNGINLNFYEFNSLAQAFQLLRIFYCQPVRGFKRIGPILHQLEMIPIEHLSIKLVLGSEASRWNKADDKLVVEELKKGSGFTPYELIAFVHKNEHHTNCLNLKLSWKITSFFPKLNSGIIWIQPRPDS